MACSPTSPSTAGTPPPASVVHDSVLWQLTAGPEGSTGVELRLGIRNLSHSDSFTGAFLGPCEMLGHVEAYSEGRWQEPEPVFDVSSDPLYYDCPAVGPTTVRLAPGEATSSDRWHWSAFGIPDDSLSAGSYRLGAHSIPVDPIPDSSSQDEWWRSTDRVELVGSEPVELER